jgi:hypothetical protein
MREAIAMTPGLADNARCGLQRISMRGGDKVCYGEFLMQEMMQEIMRPRWSLFGRIARGMLD